MNKIIFFLLIAFLVSHQNSNAQLENARIDREEIYQKNESSPNSNPQLDYLFYSIYTYNNGGNQYTHRETFSRPTINDNFTETSMFIRTYDMNDRLETVTGQIYNGANYMNSNQSRYEYNNNGDISKEEKFIYVGEWMENSQDSYFYNNDFTLSYFISGNWDILSNDYVPNTRREYSYDNGILDQIEYFTYSGNTPISDYRRSYFYDFNNEIDYILQENNTGSSWVNGRLEDYNYFVDILFDITYKLWDSNSSSWVNQAFTEFVYDGNLISEVIEKAYDESLVNTNETEGWFDTYKIVYFTSTLSTDEVNIEKGLAYPNPFKNQLTITLPKSLSTAGKLYLYDSMGKEIMKTELKSGTKSISLINGHLAKGIYFVKISSKDYQQTIKIVKE